MSSTHDNLWKAFAGESQASRKYRAFADRAEREGYPQIAKLFRAASESETIHATNDLQIMRALRSTAENLQAAIDGETYEYTDMYPGFTQTAKQEGQKAAAKIFNEAKETEEFHATYYREALEHAQKKQDLPPRDYYVCTVCGYTAENEPPDTCPVCNTKKTGFRKID